MGLLFCETITATIVDVMREPLPVLVAPETDRAMYILRKAIREVAFHHKLHDSPAALILDGSDCLLCSSVVCIESLKHVAEHVASFPELKAPEGAGS
jgi:hypothetical protein